MPEPMKIPTIRVKARNEAIRQTIKHPRGGAFRETLTESVAWPLDAFTKKRLQDGTVVRDVAVPASKQKDEPKKPVKKSFTETA